MDQRRQRGTVTLPLPPIEWVPVPYWADDMVANQYGSNRAWERD